LYAYSIRPKIFFSREKRMVTIKPAIDMPPPVRVKAERGACRLSVGCWNLPY
jgi:hypothetical protein